MYSTIYASQCTVSPVDRWAKDRPRPRARTLRSCYRVRSRRRSSRRTSASPVRAGPHRRMGLQGQTGPATRIANKRPLGSTACRAPPARGSVDVVAPGDGRCTSRATRRANWPERSARFAEERRTTMSPHWKVLPGTSDCTNSLPIAPTAASAPRLVRSRTAEACQACQDGRRMSPDELSTRCVVDVPCTRRPRRGELNAQIHTNVPVATPKQTKCKI